MSLLFSNKLLAIVGQLVLRKKNSSKGFLRPQGNKQDAEDLQSNTSGLPCHTFPGKLPVYFWRFT